jgi:hypothetical protein
MEPPTRLNNGSSTAAGFLARSLLVAASTALAALFLAPNLPAAARADGLTAQADPRAVQWSTAAVEARLISHGSIQMLTADGSIRACVDELRVEDVFDGNISPNDTIHLLILQGNGAVQPTTRPALIGTEFVLLLMPLSTARLELPDGSQLSAPRDTMVAVYQIASKDLPPDHRQDLLRVIHDTRAADAAVTSQVIHDQVAAFAEPHDDVEQEQAEKSVYDIGPRALPELNRRLSAAPSLPTLAADRLRRAIKDLSPPPLRPDNATKS